MYCAVTAVKKRFVGNKDCQKKRFVGDKDCPTQKTRTLKITKEANACGKQCPKVRDETVDVTPSTTNCEGR